MNCQGDLRLEMIRRVKQCGRLFGTERSTGWTRPNVDPCVASDPCFVGSDVVQGLVVVPRSAGPFVAGKTVIRCLRVNIRPHSSTWQLLSNYAHNSRLLNNANAHERRKTIIVVGAAHGIGDIPCIDFGKGLTTSKGKGQNITRW